ncbi:hypothetical protein SCLCIDRAFT_1220731 [Scleroderma citrinum Foug A]|uniref:Uncharacterized protein n=1 Tax=Scleroderma citrinum Foug A TaxID=1036808 RepID=A0A0C3DIL1_9AGAM|nr:hypothetical protein SCLCIDRAFT_1220731 [Scleroderma citrinum Foug A]
MITSGPAPPSEVKTVPSRWEPVGMLEGAASPSIISWGWRSLALAERLLRDCQSLLWS